MVKMDRAKSVFVYLNPILLSYIGTENTEMTKRWTLMKTDLR